MVGEEIKLYFGRKCETGALHCLVHNRMCPFCSSFFSLPLFLCPKYGKKPCLISIFSVTPFYPLMTVWSQEQEVVRLGPRGRRPTSGAAGWMEKSVHSQCVMWRSRVPCGIFSKISLFTNALCSEFPFWGT